jgi:carboxymethylenebutenolidase
MAYARESENPMAIQVTFAAKTGKQIGGALAEPPGSTRAGGVVVVQEWWGLSDYIRSTCDRFAEAGFVGLAPDLFDGKKPKTVEEAGQLMTALDKKNAVEQIASAVAFLKSQPRCNGKVAVVGFCMGGALTLASARYADGISAAVPFYGVPELPMDEYAKVRVPILAHFAKKDEWAKASVAEEIQKRVQAGGGRMELFVYDAGHAFMRDTDPHVHDAAAARLAWDRTIQFLKTHLV